MKRLIELRKKKLKKIEFEFLCSCGAKYLSDNWDTLSQEKRLDGFIEIGDTCPVCGTANIICTKGPIYK